MVTFPVKFSHHPRQFHSNLPVRSVFFRLSSLFFRLNSFFPNSYTIVCANQKHNSFLFNPLRTLLPFFARTKKSTPLLSNASALSAKTTRVGVSLHFFNDSLSTNPWPLPKWSYLHIGTFPRLISFICHSYENCRGVGVFFPFWNSPTVTCHFLTSPLPGGAQLGVN